MRITEKEKNVIIDAVKSTDPDAKVWLFGSRVDDSKKGGDIDLVVSKDGQEAFFKFTVTKGILLNG